MSSRISVILAMFFFVSYEMAVGLDNPDAPDRLTEFEVKSKLFLNKIENPKDNTSLVDSYLGYEKFLDNELNKAYRQLLKKLDKKNIANLARAQKQWIRFRDSEFEFVETTWNRENFGSSYALSRGAYRTTFVRDRTITLLTYLKNYK